MPSDENDKLQLTNELLLEMVKNQKENFKKATHAYIATTCGLLVLMVAMVVGFFWYESQFEVTDTVTTEKTVTQEVSGDDSDIVNGNQYNDSAVHNQE